MPEKYYCRNASGGSINSELKEKTLANISKCAGDMLCEETDYIGSVKLSAGEQVQPQIVDVAAQFVGSPEFPESSKSSLRPISRPIVRMRSLRSL